MDDRSPGTRRSGRRMSRPAVVAAAQLATPALLGFAVPVVGVLLSVLAAFLAVDRAGQVVWGSGRGRRLRIAALGVAALWLPAVLSFSGVLRAVLGEPAGSWAGATAWLLLPLCAPEDRLTPAVVALVVYAAGAAAGVVLRRPWPWVLGGLAASVAYDLTLALRSAEIVC